MNLEPAGLLGLRCSFAWIQVSQFFFGRWFNGLAIGGGGCFNGGMADEVVTVAEILDRTYRAESGRIMATLIRVFGGDFDLAEEALQDAVAAALTDWEANAVPDNPEPPNPGVDPIVFPFSVLGSFCSSNRFQRHHRATLENNNR